MVDSSEDIQTSAMLQSKEHGELLDIIDALRTEGVSHYVPLPQLIVTGDQSSGKSSVLEAVSGVRFPVKDNLCTRFATELVLRRSEQERLRVNIIPDPDRPEDEKVQLINFQAPDLCLDELGALTEQAKDAMGLSKGSGRFSRDVLKVEIMGPKQPNLTLVDLPGLIHAENEDQDKTDVDIVSSLVQSYMENPRSIILCIVSAKSDYANQAVTSRAREADPGRLRTLGIITKPDKLDRGSEMERDYVDLVRLEKARGFRLGWHAIRNRDFHQKTCSDEERDRTEADFFAGGVWATVPRHCLGIAALRSRLSAVLTDHIASHLPTMAQEVNAEIRACRMLLQKLGTARSKPSEQRRYLLQISERFGYLVQEAAKGTYNDPFFGDAMTKLGYVKRLRAIVQNAFRDFSSEMHCKGHNKKIVESHAENTRDTITRTAFIKEVQTRIRRSRGRELPGTFNPLIVGDLFFQQSRPWKALVDKQCRTLLDAVQNCLELILSYVADEATYRALNLSVLGPKIEQLGPTVFKKANELLRPHQQGHPITYNHYFTDTVQKARHEHQKEDLKKALHRRFGMSAEHGSFDIPEITSTALLDALNPGTEQDMDLYACSELTSCMEAYYKVAMKTLIDNVAALASESCLLDALPSLLSFETIMDIDDEELSSIAGESVEVQSQRTAATSKLRSLEHGLQIIQKFCRHRSRAVYDEERLDDTVQYSSLKDHNQAVRAEEVDIDEQLRDGQYIESVPDSVDEKADIPIAAPFTDETHMHQNAPGKSKRRKVKRFALDDWN